MSQMNSPPPPSSTNSNRIAAGICGILIGGFGVHKFILGLTTPGLIMLLVTVLTCGVGGIVMGIIGLIEGIIYLTKTDEQFHQEYVVNKKAWF
ncbi:MAG: TM2 domain-containing protein [Burkholderiales bacterium]|nr:TM2 domain-containing protein [Phycisphaerae bacterium]